jgi:hypothetical protein
MLNYLRLLYAVPIWLLFLMCQIPFFILGWILIPLAAACKAYETRISPVTGKTGVHWTWKIMFPWGNEEDGILAGQIYRDFKNDFLQIVYWTALRNPTNNLRYVPHISCKINPKKVGFIGSFGSSSFHYHETLLKYDTKVPQWFFAWQGLYSNFYVQFNLRGKLRRFWIGWKIFPTDIYGVTEYRKHGAGFATQWKVVK